MKVAIAGCGRSGTCMLTEIIAGSSLLESPQYMSKTALIDLRFKNNTVSKLIETFAWGYTRFELLMNRHQDMKILWSVRDPRDILMSKLIRSRNGAQGDGKADDGTPSTAIADIKKMRDLHERATKEFPYRIYTVRMEDIITDFEGTITDVCEFLDIPYEKNMETFYTRMRNTKKRRYKTLDKGEVSKWQNWKDAYNGFFKNTDLDLLFSELQHEVEWFDYE